MGKGRSNAKDQIDTDAGAQHQQLSVVSGMLQYGCSENVVPYRSFVWLGTYVEMTRHCGANFRSSSPSYHLD